MFNQPVRQSHYEQALVCLNGHLITDHLLSAPQRAAPFCKKCGAETISECPSCTAPIQGNYIVPNVIAKSSYRRATTARIAGSRCRGPLERWKRRALRRRICTS